MSGFDTGLPPKKVQDMFEKVEIDSAVSARKFLVFGTHTIVRSSLFALENFEAREHVI
jgi:hypothetical protein